MRGGIIVFFFGKKEMMGKITISFLGEKEMMGRDCHFLFQGNR